jgi:hypothetical protein
MPQWHDTELLIIHDEIVTIISEIAYLFYALATTNHMQQRVFRNHQISSYFNYALKWFQVMRSRMSALWP